MSDIFTNYSSVCDCKVDDSSDDKALAKTA